MLNRIPSEEDPMDEEGQLNKDGEGRPRKKKLLSQYLLLASCCLIVLSVGGLIIRHPGLLAGGGPVLAAVTNEEVKLPPTSAGLADASSATATSANAGELQTPDNYLDLMSSDPSTLPANKQPIAIALNKILYGMKDADSEQRNAEKDFQTQGLDPIQVPKDKQLLEGAKTFAINLKAVSEKRLAYYQGIGNTLGADLKAAGTPDEMVTKVTTLFIDRSGVRSGIAHSEGAAKVAGDIIAIINQLQQNRTKWKSSPEGKLSFSDRETMNKFNSLIQTLNTDLHAVQPPIGAM